MDEKRRREAQAGLSVAIQTLLEAIPPAAFEAFHQEADEKASDSVTLDDARLLLAGEMMASAYLLLEKNVAPRDILLNTWDLIATMTEVLSVEHLAEMIPEAPAAAKKGAAAKAKSARVKAPARPAKSAAAKAKGAKAKAARR